MGLDLMTICTSRSARFDVSVIRWRVYSVRIGQQIGHELMLFYARRLVETARIISGCEASDRY